MPSSSKSSAVVLINENFSTWPTGPLPADYTAQGEYMCLPAAPRADDWHDPINRTGHKGPPDQSIWHVKKVRNSAAKCLAQPSNVNHDQAIVATGRRDWRTGQIQATLSPQTDRLCGVIVGFRHARQFFAIVLVGKSAVRLQVLQYDQGNCNLLAEMPVKISSKNVRLGARFQPGLIEPILQGKSLGPVEAPGLASGGVGLLANGPCKFFKVNVTTTAAEKRRIEAARRRRTKTVAKLQQEFPQAQKCLELNIDGLIAGRQIRFADLNGDGKEEIILAMPEFVQGQQWTYRVLACLTAIDLQGKVLWQIGTPPSNRERITADLPFQAADIDGDGKVEVIACMTDRLMIIDGMTGRIKKSARTPIPPKMQAYWNEISQYWGDGHGDDLPRAIPDAIRLCNLTGSGPYRDLLIKDRYHNLWAYTGDLKRLWLHQCTLGHYPFTSDINDDGYDEIMAGYSRLDRHGNLTGRLVLGDHPDACFWMKMPNGRIREFHPAGDAGLIIGERGGPFRERHLGHVQHLSVANFDQRRDGLEMICITYWGEPGIVYMLDMDGRVLRDTESIGLGAVCAPVNWTGDGTELIMLTPDPVKGGLYDADFNRVVPLPEKNRPTLCCEVRDVLNLGVDQIVVWDHKRLQVYAPESLPKPGRKRYVPEKPHVNQSNYLVYYSLPRWQ